MDIVFSKIWFDKYQKILLFLLNCHIIKIWFRWILRIKKNDCKLNVRITEITPNSFSYGDKYFKKDDKIIKEITTDFRTNDKFARRLYFSFKPIWELFHLFDTNFANKFYRELNLGFDTLTIYPVNGSTVDGNVSRFNVNEDFSTIISGAGSRAEYNASWNDAWHLHIQTSTITNYFKTNARAFYLFDTSSLTSGATISAAVFSIYIIAKYTNIGDTNYELTASSPASNTVLANGDYANYGSTSFGNMSVSGATTSSYNSINLNSSGISNISKTNISKFGARNAWDLNGSFTGIWGYNVYTSLAGAFAGYTGTTQDPKLVITYTVTLPGSSKFFQLF